MGKVRVRASRTEILRRLQRLLGPDAESKIQEVVRLLDAGSSRDAVAALKAYDDTIGGYCGMPAVFSKPDGVYRPLGYIPVFLESPYPREMARYIIDAICQHVENLLQRVALLGFLSRMSDKLMSVGQLVSSMRPFLPKQLYEDLQWLASEVYNHAKHSVDVFHRATPEERAHYFELDEALAIYLVGRELAVQLERWSGKSKNELMKER